MHIAKLAPSRPSITGFMAGDRPAGPPPVALETIYMVVEYDPLQRFLLIRQVESFVPSSRVNGALDGLHARRLLMRARLATTQRIMLFVNVDSTLCNGRVVITWVRRRGLRARVIAYGAVHSPELERYWKEHGADCYITLAEFPNDARKLGGGAGAPGLSGGFPVDCA